MTPPLSADLNIYLATEATSYLTILDSCQVCYKCTQLPVRQV